MGYPNRIEGPMKSMANPMSTYNMTLRYMEERIKEKDKERKAKLAKEEEKRRYELFNGSSTSSASSAASSAYLEVISTSSGKTPKPNNNRTYSFGNQSFSTKSQNPAAKTKEKSEKTGSSCIIS